jgi:hypothetical protein
VDVSQNGNMNDFTAKFAIETQSSGVSILAEKLAHQSRKNWTEKQ